MFYDSKCRDRIDTPLLEEIKRLYQNGISMIAGTSAGCVGLTGNLMLTGYETTSYQALRDGSFPEPSIGTSSNCSRTLMKGFTYDPLGGLGFLSGYILDVHFG